MTVHDEQAVRSAIAKTVEEFIRDATPSTAVAKIASFITFECLGMKGEAMCEAAQARWPEATEPDLDTAFVIAADASRLRGKLFHDEADKLTGKNVVEFPGSKD